MLSETLKYLYLLYTNVPSRLHSHSGLALSWSRLDLHHRRPSIQHFTHPIQRPSAQRRPFRPSQHIVHPRSQLSLRRIHRPALGSSLLRCLRQRFLPSGPSLRSVSPLCLSASPSRLSQAACAAAVSRRTSRRAAAATLGVRRPRFLLAQASAGSRIRRGSSVNGDCGPAGRAVAFRKEGEREFGFGWDGERGAAGSGVDRTAVFAVENGADAAKLGRIGRNATESSGSEAETEEFVSFHASISLFTDAERDGHCAERSWKRPCEDRR